MTFKYIEYMRASIASVFGIQSMNSRLISNYRVISPDDKIELRDLLATQYFRDPPNYLDTSAGQQDLSNHMSGRLDEDRKTVVPWLNSLFTLNGSKIIEIGCGTGSSSIALAEQGARLVGYDIDQPSLEVAAKRCQFYGLEVEFKCESATRVAQEDIEGADAAIFFASIEHMTTDERIASLSRVWSHLRKGSYLVIVETPNRLWWYDYHTSHLPFFMWLPDDLAVLYSRKSPREPFNEQLASPAMADNMLRLVRLGRGISYHEFELALGDLSGLEVSSFNRYKNRSRIRYLRWLTSRGLFEMWLRLKGPKISSAFYEFQIALAIRKS